jgi:hypothetical protein
MVTLGNLPFNKRMAEMFMSIARNRVLSNAQHVALLPEAMSRHGSRDRQWRRVLWHATGIRVRKFPITLDRVVRPQ